MKLNTFENIDCMEGMKRYPDKFFDLAIVDPPYGIGEDGRKNHSRGKLAIAKDYRNNVRYDDKIPEREYFEELVRVSKNQIIWGINYFTNQYKFSAGRIFWDKDNGDNDFSDGELAYQSFTNSIRKVKYRWNGMLQENMAHKEIRIHPNHKPIYLYKWLLSKYANPGDKILDTHVGSGSSLIACIDMGFDYVGFELDTDYYNGACKRIKEFQSQYKLAI